MQKHEKKFSHNTGLVKEQSGYFLNTASAVYLDSLTQHRPITLPKSVLLSERAELHAVS